MVQESSRGWCEHDLEITQVEDKPMYCVVSGANRGLGLAMVRRLTEMGHQVAAICREGNEELARLPVETIEGIDLASNDCMTALRSRFQDRRIDLLVSNAGIVSREQRLDEEAIEQARLQFEVNALGTMRLVAALGSGIPAGGRVAVISSRLASFEQNPHGGYYGYRMSKVACNMLVKALSADFASACVFAVHPGWMRTRLGGPEAPLDPQVCANRIVELCERAGPESTGKFFLWSGESLAW